MSNVFTNIGTLFGVGGMIATVVFGLLAAKNKVTIQSLENTVSAYEGEIRAKSLVIATREGTLVEKDKQLLLLTQKAHVLEEVTTQAPQIAKLAYQIGRQHKESQKSMTMLAQKLGDIAEKLGNQAFADRAKGGVDANTNK